MIADIVKETVTITGFVLVMMLVVEYANVLSHGAWQSGLAGHRWGQYLLGAFLGVAPGCLGAFAAVAMYAHRVLSLGAVVATMIATSGDESFVMLALIPRQALILFGVLFGLALLAGALTDAVAGKIGSQPIACCKTLAVHTGAECGCFPGGRIVRQWRECSAPRGILATGLALALLGLLSGALGPGEWNWIRVTLVASLSAALFIVGTVPDHFLEEHLWRHVARKHAPRVFLWTLGALFAMHLVTDVLHLESAIQEGRWIVLLVACLAGLIPESGPHLIFVTLFAKGAVPFSVLLASSIVQDGHGMLPMLAESRKAFVVVKGVNFAVGLMIGAAAMGLGY